MEISQLRYMYAVSQYGSFTRAAEHLYVTQPTLSQQIRRLEEEIGLPLFRRTTRSVELTDAGRAVLERVTPLLRCYDELQEQIGRLRDDIAGRRTVRLGVLATFSHLDILDTIQRFQAQDQTLSVQLHIQMSNVLLDMLRDGRLDAAIANIAPEQAQALGPGAAVRVFARDVICAVLHSSHPLAGRERLTLPELAAEPLVMLSGGSSIRRRMEQAFRQAGLAPAVAWECPEIHSLIGLLRSNAGVSFLSSRVAGQYAQPPLVIVPLAPPVGTQTAVVYWKNSPAAPLLERFADYIVHCCQES